MSLHRVSSMESWQRARGSSPTSIEHRKMSFNPISNGPPAASRGEPVTAVEVSKTRRIVQVSFAVVYCLFSSGIVFGYAAIKPVLVREGVYRDLCPEGEARRVDQTCYEQEIRLNLMFTIAAVATNVCALLVGIVLDRYGPRSSSIVGCFSLVLGSLLLAFAAQIPFDAYIPGYLFLALGGPFIFISSFQLSNTFPQNSGLILALLTGAFDSSSAIFLIYRLIYSATNGAFNSQKFFSIYTIVPLLLFLIQVLVMPKASYKTLGETMATASNESEEHAINSDEALDNEVLTMGASKPGTRDEEEAADELTSLLGKGVSSQQNEERKKREISGVWGALHGQTAWMQMHSSWFILIALFTMVQMTRINYFVATIRPQYTYLLKSYEAAETINEFFDIALPLGGVLSIPFIGLILDNTSTPFVMTALVSIAVAIGILGCLPYYWAAYANICLFVLYRPFYYTAVSDYSAKVFGFETFGKVYGLIICLSGLFNFSQSALDALTYQVFDKDPVPVNLLLLAMISILGVALIVFVWRQRNQMRRNAKEEETATSAEGSTSNSTFHPNGNDHGTSP
ncbi:hypothetical protein MMC25_004725 [Agyrium rufum]|nr:hypothetical protein [Agyrium rufum]